MQVRGIKFTLIRSINEDRISILLNKIINKKKVSYFAIFDGHNGCTVSIELKETLHEYIFNDSDLFTNPKKALVNQFTYFDDNLIDKYKGEDKTGSSAIIGLLFDNKLYIATVGNSRAIISTGLGDSVINITTEHIAHREKDRIIKAGGSIYLDNNRIRINPGGMVISRSIGDVKNKFSAYGGIEGVIIPTPDVYCIDLNYNIDFIIFGTNALFEKLTNADIAKSVFHSANKCGTNDDSFETLNKEICRNFTRQALFKEVRENISCIFLCGTNLYNNYENRNTEVFINAIEEIKNKDFNII